MFATVILVLVLLGAIYRSLLVALSPLIVVLLAYFTATGFIYLFAKSGATVSSNSTGIIVVLMFGVGTDYCLLLVSRYREELRRFEDKHDAMQNAVRRAGPAILASGLTVSLAMLVLASRRVRQHEVARPGRRDRRVHGDDRGLTLLPALLTIFGRRGFWPRRSTRRVRSGARRARAHRSLAPLRRRVLQRPGPAVAVTAGVFLLGALGLIAYKVDYSSTTFFKKSVESVEGFKVMRQNFPAGTLSPMTALVEQSSGPVTPEDVALASSKLRSVKGVAAVVPTRQLSTNHQIAIVNVILKGDPNDSSSLNLVPKLRDAVANVKPGVTVQIGGGTAISYDFNKATQNDLKLIVPLALLVMAVILGILLQAIVAPLVLLASVVLSFACTLGISILFIRFVVGDAGFDASIPTFAFIFLVALGIDYTIFLMARVREEARRHGTREGMLRAIAVTGPVITSAGVILAGTFSVLMTLPVTFTFDLGFMVALGILLDTFIVRTIMVPAAVELIGDKIWWPSTAKAGGRVSRGHGGAATTGAGRGRLAPHPLHLSGDLVLGHHPAAAVGVIGVENQADSPEADDPRGPEAPASRDRPDTHQHRVYHHIREQVLAELPLSLDAGEGRLSQLLLVVRCDQNVVVAHQRPFQTGLRFSANAAIPSRKSSEPKQDSRSSISSRSCSGVSRAIGVERVDRVLVASRRERGVGGDLGGQVDRRALELRVVDDLVDQTRSARLAGRRSCGRSGRAPWCGARRSCR